MIAKMLEKSNKKLEVLKYKTKLKIIAIVRPIFLFNDKKVKKKKFAIKHSKKNGK